VAEGARKQGGGVGGISPRASAWVAWSMCALSLALTVLSLLLIALITSHPGVHIFEHWIENTALAIGFSTVGAVVVSHWHPRNPMGWMFCVVGLLFAAVHFVAEYAIYALLAEPGSLPAGEPAAWVCSWLFAPQLGLSGLLALLFPNGRLPSARWRWFVWFSVLSILLATVMAALSPGKIDIGLGSIHNPLGIERLPNVYKPAEGLLLSLILIAGGSQVVRLRRAGGVERQQIKWFAYAILVTASGVFLKDIIPVALSGARWLQWVGFVPLVVGAVSIPIAMGVAILRCRLYEIDILINRTLVYGSLTLLLVALYFVGIVVLQRLFVLLTGEDSTLVIVASTLMIAALFNPLRHRIQSFIDRRFYRRKYDAAKTLEGFSLKLRDETHLAALSDNLVGVVRETMQPAHVSLWLRPDTASKGRKGR
jgi:hypothetical protein